MKRLQFFILAMISMLLFSTCKKDEIPTELNIVITQQPTGGHQIIFLAARMEGKIIGEKKTIQVKAEWRWENANNAAFSSLTSYQYIFDSNSTTYKSIVLSAPSGYILINHFWLRLTWEDDKGRHILDSYKVNCEV